MLRGDVWWVNFDPSLGGEIQKTRPAIIVSNNSSNRSLNRAVIQLNGEVRKAMADQLATVSKLRLRERIGIPSEADLRLVDQAIRIQLGLGTTLG